MTEQQQIALYRAAKKIGFEVDEKSQEFSDLIIMTKSYDGRPVYFAIHDYKGYAELVTPSMRKSCLFLRRYVFPMVGNLLEKNIQELLEEEN